MRSSQFCCSGRRRSRVSEQQKGKPWGIAGNYGKKQRILQEGIVSLSKNFQSEVSEKLIHRYIFVFKSKRRRSSWFRFHPQFAMLEYFLYHIRLISFFDEWNYSHLLSAPGTFQRINFINFLYHGCPAWSTEFTLWSIFFSYLKFLFCDVRWFTTDNFASNSSGFITVKSVISNRVFALIWNMLSNLGDKIKWPENLKIATNSTFQCLASRFREFTTILVFGFVNNMIRIC